MFQDNFATIVSISQFSQFVHWKIVTIVEEITIPPHALSQLSQIFYENCDSFDIPWHSLFKNVNFLRWIKILGATIVVEWDIMVVHLSIIK